MNWFSRLFAPKEARLPDHWKPIAGTWCGADGVMEGRCPPIEPYEIPPDKSYAISPKIVKQSTSKQKAS